jgi:PAS domain S-box-containing protein
MVASNTLYQHLFIEAAVALIFISEDYLIQEWNKEATLALGCNKDEVTEKNFLRTLVPENQQKAFYQAIAGLQTDGAKTTITIGLLHKEGFEIHCLLCIQYITYTGRNGFLISASDFKKLEESTLKNEFTAIGQVENQLYESRQMLHLVLDNIPQRVFWKDRNLNYLGCNRAALEDHPLNHPKEIIGKSDYDFFTKETAEAYRQDDLSVMETNTPKINYEEEKTRLDGSKYWLRTSKVPLHDRNGNVIGILGTYEDVTKRKQVEKKLYEQNTALQKLNAELDNFVYRASHDLRAPLMSVLGLAQLMKLTEEREKQFEYLELIVKSIGKLDAFIKDIIDFSRNSRMAVEKDEIKFKELFDEVFENFHYMPFASSIRKVLNIKEKDLFFSDSRRLRVVFNNLISNSIKYCNTHKNAFISVNLSFVGNQAVVEIEDNGQGIGQEHLEKIFDIFYRANESSSGSGLGLYIVKECLQKLNGNITVWSELGKGTKFKLVIPSL